MFVKSTRRYAGKYLTELNEKMDKKIGIWALAITLIVIVSVFGTIYYYGVGPFNRERTRLVVSTTTSLYDTGLLDTIEDQFESKYPIDIYFISAGTGIAINYAQRGDADMILVHAPSKELAFLEDGYGVCRKIIAYNFFAIVGPEEDPANITSLSPVVALNKIVEAGRNVSSKVLWISRGDDSGTYTKEKELWTASGFNWTILRDEAWYAESGTGMGKTLQIADEFSAYTLADMGTYLKYYTDNLIYLIVHVDQGKELINVYSAIAVNNIYNPNVNFEASINFIKYLVSEEGQQIIDQFGSIYPQKLFYPAVNLLKDNTDPTLVNWIEEFAYFDGQECPENYQNGHKELYN